LLRAVGTAIQFSSLFIYVLSSTVDGQSQIQQEYKQQRQGDNRKKTAHKKATC
jgi:hypothetical protein